MSLYQTFLAILLIFSFSSFALDKNEIIQMAKAKLDDDIMIRLIAKKKDKLQLSSHDISELRREGVRPKVIVYLIQILHGKTPSIKKTVATKKRPKPQSTRTLGKKVVRPKPALPKVKATPEKETEKKYFQDSYEPIFGTNYRVSDRYRVSNKDYYLENRSYYYNRYYPYPHLGIIKYHNRYYYNHHHHGHHYHRRSGLNIGIKGGNDNVRFRINYSSR